MLPWSYPRAAWTKLKTLRSCKQWSALTCVHTVSYCLMYFVFLNAGVLLSKILAEHFGFTAKISLEGSTSHMLNGWQIILISKVSVYFKGDFSFFGGGVVPSVEKPCIDICLWIIKGNPHIIIIPPQLHPGPSFSAGWQIHTVSHPRSSASFPCVALPTHESHAPSQSLPWQPIQLCLSNTMSQFRGCRGKCRFQWLFWYRW